MPSTSDLLFLAILLAAAYGFLASRSWSPSQFNRGITILRLSRSFSLRPPSEIVGKLTETCHVDFLFTDPAHCIFRSPFTLFSRPSKSRFRLPLHGEMRLSAGAAHVTVRIPTSFIVLHGALLAGLLFLVRPSTFYTEALGFLAGMDLLTLLFSAIVFLQDQGEFPRLVDKIAAEVARVDSHYPAA